MTRSEKMKYRRGGKIVLSNMYDEILHIDEFKKLETYRTKQAAILAKYLHNQRNHEGHGYWQRSIL